MDRHQCLHEIIERELKMFLSVRNEGGVASCQEMPDTFRLMREITFSALSDAVLESYLQDLVEAEDQKRNLMTEKYGRMDNRIPRLKFNSEIHDIVEVESGWRAELCKEFPHVVLDDGQYQFENYLFCELETYSDRTLAIYAMHIAEMLAAGRNLARERYEFLMQRLGRTSLEVCEKELREKGNA